MADDQNQDISDPLLNKDRHANKRRMAYICLAGMMIYPLIFIFYINPDVASKYDSIVNIMFMTYASVILSYMGATAVDSVFFQKNKTP